MDIAKTILDELNIVNKKISFRKTPSSDFAVYTDLIDTQDGADLVNNLKKHSIIIELHTDVSDSILIDKVKQKLDDYGIKWQTTSEDWLDDVQKYLTTYSFDFYEKEY